MSTTVASRMKASLEAEFKKRGIPLGKTTLVLDFEQMSFGNVPRDVARKMIKNGSVPFFKTRMKKNGQFSATYVEIPDAAIDLIPAWGRDDDD